MKEHPKHDEEFKSLLESSIYEEPGTGINDRILTRIDQYQNRKAHI